MITKKNVSHTCNLHSIPFRFVMAFMAWHSKMQQQWHTKLTLLNFLTISFQSSLMMPVYAAAHTHTHVCISWMNGPVSVSVWKKKRRLGFTFYNNVCLKYFFFAAIKILLQATALLCFCGCCIFYVYIGRFFEWTKK